MRWRRFWKPFEVSLYCEAKQMAKLLEEEEQQAVSSKHWKRRVLKPSGFAFETPNVFQEFCNTNSLQNICVEEPRLFCHQCHDPFYLKIYWYHGPVDIEGRNISSSQHKFWRWSSFSRLVGYEFPGGIFTYCTYCCWQTSSDRKPRLIGFIWGISLHSQI